MRVDLQSQVVFSNGANHVILQQESGGQAVMGRDVLGVGSQSGSIQGCGFAILAAHFQQGRQVVVS